MERHGSSAPWRQPPGRHWSKHISLATICASGEWSTAFCSGTLKYGMEWLHSRLRPANGCVWAGISACTMSMRASTCGVPSSMCMEHERIISMVMLVCMARPRRRGRLLSITSSARRLRPTHARRASSSILRPNASCVADARSRSSSATYATASSLGSYGTSTYTWGAPSRRASHLNVRLFASHATEQFAMSRGAAMTPAAVAPTSTLW